MSLASRLTAQEYQTTKQRAIEDAKTKQLSILRECTNNGEAPPPYLLTELIGKGSFGRVYKAIASSSPRQFFAVKIISIEEGDFHQPGAADTFSDTLKEVNTLKLLRNSGAKNINNIVDALLVGQSVWMITEYCAGGSVASLMRPTSGLPEKWIVPILREVAEALSWVHRGGVIHRDIKCANVLVTESGSVQLCDFGVAGIVESKFDKRRTVTGTIQWMAPELFNSTTAYGSEIDMWAFGAMAYEMATGLPPNAIMGVDISEFGSYLKSHCPRLEGDRYSSHLKDLVAICMVEEPSQRPCADEILGHPLLFNTATEYPTDSLAKLVQAYQVWEAQGGSRRSLFAAGGAQGPTHELLSVVDDGWNFGTVDLSQTTVHDNSASTADDVGSDGVDFPTPRPNARTPRRRRPPPNMKEVKVPLQVVFDPHTLSKYDDNSRAFYSRRLGSSSDLPLRDPAEPAALRESLIDLDSSLDGGRLSQFADMPTIKYRPRSSDGAGSRRPTTQDWTFPLMAPPASASLDGSYKYSPPSTSESASAGPYRSSTKSFTDLDATSVASASSSSETAAPKSIAQNRVSTASLIDLDAADDSSPAHRYAASDTASVGSETPFFLEAPAPTGDTFISALEKDITNFDVREPSLYAPLGLGNIFPTEDGGPLPSEDRFPLPSHPIYPPPPSTTNTARLPFLPAPPSADVLQGLATQDEVKADLQRMLESLGDHLQSYTDMLRELPGKGTSDLAGNRDFS